MQARGERSTVTNAGLMPGLSDIDLSPEKELDADWNSFAFSSRLPDLTADERGELRLGRPVRKQERRGSTGWGCVAVEVDAPSSLVLSELAKFEDYDRMIPVVRHSKVLSRSSGDDGSLLARCQYRVSRFLLSISAVHSVDVPAGVVRFDLDPAEVGLVLREASGFWRVEPLPPRGGAESNRCRVWFRVGLRASSFLPRFFIDYAAERALRRATNWLQPHMEAAWHAEQVGHRHSQLQQARLKEISAEPAQLPGYRLLPA